MSDFRFCSLQQVYVFQLRHLHTWHTRHTRHSTPRFLGSILNLPPPAAAALTPWPRIGETRTNGCALLWVPSSLLFELSRRALVTALWSFHSGLRPIFGPFCMKALLSSSLLLRECLSFLAWKTLVWKVLARGKFTRRIPRFSVVSQDSEC